MKDRVSQYLFGVTWHYSASDRSETKCSQKYFKAKIILHIKACLYRTWVL